MQACSQSFFHAFSRLNRLVRHPGSGGVTANNEPTHIECGALPRFRCHKWYNIVDGMVRARYRKGIARAESLTPGEVNEYIINLGNASQIFCKGHRIGIDIASSDFPRYERNMNTGNPPGEDAVGIPAMQTIYHRLECASYVDLPVIPSK